VRLEAPLDVVKQALVEFGEGLTHVVVPVLGNLEAFVQLIFASPEHSLVMFIDEA